VEDKISWIDLTGNGWYFKFNFGYEHLYLQVAEKDMVAANSQ
jgi:hypothetical protein